MIPGFIKKNRTGSVFTTAQFPERDMYSDMHAGIKNKIVFTGKSKYGEGLFARQFIPKGSIITKITGKHIQFDEAVLLGEKESYPLQVGLSEYIAHDLQALWHYINHSCDPNCGITENLEVIAIKDIHKAEELFYDYSTTMLEKHWTMKCTCNAANCRHIIADFDTLVPGRQQYYLDLGVVQGFIKKYLNHNNA